VKHLSGAQLLGRLLGLPTNIRLGWKSLPGTNTLAYYIHGQITVVKKAQGVITINQYRFIIYEK
jgi:hypothetical protein